MYLNSKDFRSKVLGCWMGKNIGGTLGAPFEWKRQLNDVSFYAQDLGGEPLPNDDLDIQLLWLVALEERGVEIDAHTLSEYWVLYVTPHWSEYGTAKVNMRAGLHPPLCGTVGNLYKDSCGAFIRSEIWACIAPGNPGLAARYAYEDAILDHGNGEGTFAEVFCAALESAAFVCNDLRALINLGMTYIPEHCGVAGAVRKAVECYDAGKTWLEARDAILAGYRGDTFLGWESCTSAEDRAKGFADGKRGWDVPSNIGMLIIGLLYGEGDFAKSICTAVNCGEDTDCTGATVGSIFGIMHGIEAIPEKWIAPIGRNIKTACLNLGELGFYGDQVPANVDVLTDRTLRVAEQVRMRHGWGLQIGDAPTNLSDVNPAAMHAGGFRDALYANLNAPVYRFPEFSVAVDYGEEGPYLRDGEAKTLQLRIAHNSKTQANIALHAYTPEGCRITPTDGNILALQGFLGGTPPVTLTVEAEAVRGQLLRAAIELTIPGRPTVMVVPITLLNGNALTR